MRKFKLLPIDKISDILIIKIKDKIITNKESKCWVWFGARSGSIQPSPVIKIDEENWQVTRIIYYYYNKIDPKELEVCHKCDNTLCINPDHLWLGTHKQNIQDCINKERFCRGNNHKSSKIDYETSCEIKRLYLNKTYNQYQLAEIFEL